MKAFKQIKLNYFSDLFFIFLSFFFIFYGIFRYLQKNLILTLALSIFFTILVCTAYLFLNSNKKTLNKKQLQAEKTKFEKYLCFEDKNKIVEIIKKYYKTKYDEVVYENEIIKISGVKCYIYPLFTMEKTTAKQILDCYKKTPKNYKTIILSTSYTDKSLEFCYYMKSRITLINSDEIFDKLSLNDMLPNLNAFNILKKKKFKDIIKEVFERKKSGKFLFFGIVLSFSAVYSFFPVYYLIFGSLLILLGLYLKIFLPVKSEKGNFPTEF